MLRLIVSLQQFIQLIKKYMGLIIKNYELNGLTIPTSYLGVNKSKSGGTLNNFTVAVNVYASADAKVKGLQPLTTFYLALDLSHEDNSSTPVFKLVYAKLKEMYSEYKDLKDFDTTKPPVITSQALKDGIVAISGTKDSGSDLKISTNLKLTDLTINQTDASWNISLSKDNYDSSVIHIMAEELNAIPSDSLLIPRQNFDINLAK